MLTEKHKMRKKKKDMRYEKERERSGWYTVRLKNIDIPRDLNKNTIFQTKIFSYSSKIIQYSTRFDTALKSL